MGSCECNNIYVCIYICVCAVNSKTILHVLNNPNEVIFILFNKRFMNYSF